MDVGVWLVGAAPPKGAGLRHVKLADDRGVEFLLTMLAYVLVSTGAWWLT